MDDLIEALQIFRKYTDVRNPTHCEHDVLYLCVVDHEEVTKEDLDRLEGLGFYYSDNEESFVSFRFGSC